MPWLPIFVDEQDAQGLLQWLNAHRDIAFLVSNGPNQWKAVPTIPEAVDGRYILWHIPSGPLWHPNDCCEVTVIKDPFQGWVGPNDEGMQPLPGEVSVPCVGDDPNIFRLDLHARHCPYSERELAQHVVRYSSLRRPKDHLHLSCFQWTGDRYGKAPDSGWKFWEQLNIWVANKAVRLGRFQAEDDDRDSDNEWGFWAFPSALGKLKSGMAYDANNWDLTEEIRMASAPQIQLQ